MDGTPLTRLVLETAAFIAVASLLMSAVGLLVARRARRSAPLRHGMLLGTLAVLCMLPAAPFVATRIDAEVLPAFRLFESGVAVVTGGYFNASKPRSGRATLPRSRHENGSSTRHAARQEPRPPGSATTSALEQPVVHPLDAREPPLDANGSVSASSIRTLTADEIPVGAVLPGQRTAGLNPAARAAVADRGRFVDFTAVGMAIVAAWWLGTIVSLLLTLRGARRVAGIVRRSPLVADAAVLAIHETLARQLGLRRAPMLRSSAGVGVPFAWGLLRPVVVIPESLTNAGQEFRLRAILLHELAHVRRRDGWIGLLQRVVAALYWWNPLVPALNARLAEAREQICDAHVLAGGCPPRDYAEILVELAAQVAQHQPVGALGLVSRSPPQLTRRVQHLLEDPPMSTSLRSFGRLCVMVLMIVGATAAVLVAAVIFKEHRMTAVRLTPHPQYSQAYVGDTAIRDSFSPQLAVPAAQPAAESFSAPDPNWQPGAIAEPTLEMNPFVTPEEAAAMSPPPLLADNQPLPDDFGNIDQDFAAPEAEPFYPGPPVEADNAPKVETGPTPNPNWPPKGGPQFIGQGSIHALALIELVGNEDGTLKDLRWFTESLGTGDEAATKLGERLEQFVATQPSTVYRMVPRQTSNGTVYMVVQMEANGQEQPVAPTPDFGGDAPYYFPDTPTPRGRGGMGMAAGPQPAVPPSAPFQRVLAAQVTASPQLRYEHVARVIALCESHVQRVIIGQADVSPQLRLTLGFVRDGAGNKISSSPVLIWNNAVVSRPEFGTKITNGKAIQEPRMVTETVSDKIVEVHSLPPLLMTWRQTLGDDPPKSLAALIRADDGVDAALVEQVVQAVLPAGIERVVLEPLATPQVEVPPVAESALPTY